MVHTYRRFLHNVYPYILFSAYLFTAFPFLCLFPRQIVQFLPVPNMECIHFKSLLP